MAGSCQSRASLLTCLHLTPARSLCTAIQIPASHNAPHWPCQAIARRTEQSLAAEPHCMRAQPSVGCTTLADPLSNGRAGGHLQGHAGARTAPDGAKAPPAAAETLWGCMWMQGSDAHSALRRPSASTAPHRSSSATLPNRPASQNSEAVPNTARSKTSPRATRLQTHPSYTQKNPPAQCTLYMNTQARLGTWAAACKRAGRAAAPRPSQDRCAPTSLPRHALKPGAPTAGARAPQLLMLPLAAHA